MSCGLSVSGPGRRGAVTDKEQNWKEVIHALKDLDWHGAGKTLSVRSQGSTRITGTAMWSVLWGRRRPAEYDLTRTADVYAVDPLIS